MNENFKKIFELTNPPDSDEAFIRKVVRKANGMENNKASNYAKRGFIALAAAVSALVIAIVGIGAAFKWDYGAAVGWLLGRTANDYPVSEEADDIQNNLNIQVNKNEEEIILEEQEKGFPVHPLAEKYFDYFAENIHFSFLLGNDEQKGGFTDAQVAAYALCELIIQKENYDPDVGYPREEMDAMIMKYFLVTEEDIANFNYDNQKTRVIPETGNITSTGWSGSYISLVLKELEQDDESKIYKGEFYLFPGGLEFTAGEVVKNDLLNGRFGGYGQPTIITISFMEMTDENGNMYLRYCNVNSGGMNTIFRDISALERMAAINFNTQEFIAMWEKYHNGYNMQPDTMESIMNEVKLLADKTAEYILFLSDDKDGNLSHPALENNAALKRAFTSGILTDISRFDITAYSEGDIYIKVTALVEFTNAEYKEETSITVEFDMDMDYPIRNIYVGNEYIQPSAPMLPDDIYNASKMMINFPEHKKDKTEFNASVYEVDPFTLTFTLPDGWYCAESDIDFEELHYLFTSAYSRMDIYNSDGEYVGAVGYNIYEEYPDMDGNPMAIYNQIAIAGNYYSFDVRERYDIVKENDYYVTALTDVFYGAAFKGQFREETEAMLADGRIVSNAESEERGGAGISRGIVSHHIGKQVYIAMEFAHNALDDAGLLEIAESIVIH